MRYRLLFSLIVSVVLAGPGYADTEDKTLLGGWYLLDPFQYTEEKAGYSRLTGLDIELLRAIARRAGYAIKFEEVQWRQHVQDIREGRRDIAAAALKTPEREAFAYFSIPYREETNALFVRKGRAAELPAESSKEPIERNRLSRPGSGRAAALQTDALGLAAFTVTGVVVAFATQSEPLWLWGPILAALTGAGGGILRDVVRSDPHIPTLKGELYPEIAFVWGGVLSFFLIWETQNINPEAILTGIVVTIVGAFATRMLAIHLNLRSPGFFLRF